MPQAIKIRKPKVEGIQQNYENPGEDSYADNQPTMLNNDLNDTLNRNEDNLPDNRYNQPDKQLRPAEQRSDQKLRNGDDRTMGEQSVDESLPRPYDFLKFASPPLHTIFLPHFTPKSINFVLSIVLIIAFVVLLIYSYTKPIQNDFTWNCSIFELQNKYYPRLRYNFEFWRVFLSGLFHSNIAHFILNLLGLQIYGYFVEWYYGRLKYSLTILFSVISAHFLSSVSLPETVSTMPSAILYSILVLKVVFLFQYREYAPLANRRIFIFILLALISGINLIPIFVNNNVDFTGHIGGVLVGAFMGIFIHLQKSEDELPIGKKILKFGSLVMIALLNIICIALIYGLQDEKGQYKALNDNITIKCSEDSRRLLYGGY